MSVGDGKHRHWMHTYPNMAKNHPTESERQIELEVGEVDIHIDITILHLKKSLSLF